MKYFMKYRIEICSSIFILFLLTVVTIVSFVMNYGGLQDILIWLWMGFAVFLFANFLNNLRRRKEMLDCISQLLEGQDEEVILQQYRRCFGKQEDILRQLCNYFQETSIAEVMKNEAEMHALQNQINPHFLYNTLDVIRSRAMRYGNNDVAEMVEALGLQFRYCINRFGEMATLQQELDHVNNYLLIQKYRMGDRYQFHTVLEDEEAVLSCRMPVLTLQPIIENALQHGIRSLIRGGIITLKVCLKGNRVEITVEDNGIGMSRKELQAVRESLHGQEEIPDKSSRGAPRGIALKNVNKRIKFYYGERYGLDITSTEGVGTSVLITFPYAKE